jgi:hypothetical protein
VADLPDEYDALAERLLPNRVWYDDDTHYDWQVKQIADGLRSAVASATGPLVAEVERLQAVLAVSNAEVLASVEGVAAKLQPEFDRLRADLAAAVGLLERIRKGCYLSGYAMALDVNDYLEAHKEAAK